jgi:lysozyme family protein
MDFEDALRSVLRWEGGFSNHPKDPGGATNYGITQRTLSQWRGRPVSVVEVRNLSFEDVVPIYKKLYWDECRCGEMPDGLDLLVFDSAVNQGPNRAKRLLQRSLGVAEDGIIGPATMAAIRRLDNRALLDELVSRRAVHCASLQSDFHLGWFRRLIDMHRQALS